MKFPLVGSAVLFSLFLAFKVLPKELVNAVLSGAALYDISIMTSTANMFWGPPAGVQWPAAAVCLQAWCMLPSTDLRCHAWPRVI